MSVLRKVFIRSIVGILIVVGLLGYADLILFTAQSPNLYTDVYKASDLQYDGKYEAAIAKYEQALKKLPRFPVDTKVINVSFPTFFKYHIAFCYAKLAEAERDVSLYVQAEAAARESYETARLSSDQADALYLWGYILFKQGRYAEARAKYEQLIDAAPQNGFSDRFLEDALYALGKTYVELGDAAVAEQILAQLETMIHGTDSYFYTAGVMCALGKAYLKLGDESAARRVFAQLGELLKITVEGDHLGWDAKGIYAKIPYDLGKAYLELGEEATARRIFAQLEILLKIAIQREYVGPDAEDIYAEVVYGLGKVYLELGEETAAQRIFAMLLEHFRDSSHKTEVKRLLEKQ